MSDSTTWLDTLSAADSQKEVTNNELFDAASPATLFGRHASACSALTWAYYGGRFWDGSAVVLVNNGTLSLTNGATNYIEATTAGVVSANTSAFTVGRIRIAKVITSGGAVSSYEDHRALSYPGSSAGGTSSSIPQNSQSAAYTTVLGDAGKHILHPSADTTARVFTIDSNANVAYPLGTAITFVNQNAAGVVTIAITSDTMRLAGAGTTGSRTLAANGIATALKITTTEWIISGTGLT